MSPSFSLAACNANYTIRHTHFGTVTPTPMKVLSPDPTRVGILFADSAGNTYIGGPDLSPGHIFWTFISTTFLITQVTYQDVGTLVQEEVWAGRGAGTAELNLTEILYRPASGITGLAGGAEVIH